MLTSAQSWRPPVELDAATFDFMYPCHFAVNAALEICACGPGLVKLAPTAAEGTALESLFRVAGVSSDFTFEHLARLAGGQVVLTSKRDARLQLRGVITRTARDRLLFAVSPAFLDAACAEELGIDFTVFSPCDRSAELLVGAEMQRILTVEAVQLADRLGEEVAERREAARALTAALAAAERASLSKTAFLANMSHEIRTPLNGIVAVADILARDSLPPGQRELVNIIQSSGAMLERLLSDILDLARIESDQLTIENTPFHLGDLVRATVGLSRLRADEKGVAVHVRIDPALDIVMSGDMVRVRQVLTNLLSNAVKFTHAGSVSLACAPSDEGLVRFVVRDTGVGFPEEVGDQLFERFSQADGSITRRFGGSGLGLAISKELVGLMGGQIGCESAVGAGSTFWFEIPLAPSSATAAQPEGAERAEMPGRLLRVLVADDHPTNRRVVELMLADHAEIFSVENGKEALHAVAGRAFDLVLMDMQMPVMDGLTAVKEIRRVEAGAAHLPIIMLTANALPEHMASSLSAGADLHLEKPLTVAALFNAIEQVLQTEERLGGATMERPQAQAGARG